VTAIVPDVERTPFSSIEGLPDDIPVLERNNGDLTIMTQKEVKIFMFTTSLTKEEVIAFYHDGMIGNGWEEMSTSEQPGQFLMKTYQKGDSSRIVMVMASEGSGNTMVTLQIPEIPNP
jgi:hypothetical protein